MTTPLEATQSLLKISLMHMDLNGFKSLLNSHLRQINSSSALLENANLAFRKAATQMYVEASQGLDLLVGIANELSEDKQAMIRDALILGNAIADDLGISTAERNLHNSFQHAINGLKEAIV